LQQVLYNLVLNSAQALGSAANSEPMVTIITRWRPVEAMAELEIVDNGPGFTPEVKQKLFQKHITNKADGHGIGLMTVKKIIEQHKGTITAGSSSNGGALFNIQLPASTPIEGRIDAEATVPINIREQH